MARVLDLSAVADSNRCLPANWSRGWNANSLLISVPVDGAFREFKANLSNLVCVG